MGSVSQADLAGLMDVYATIQPANSHSSERTTGNDQRYEVEYIRERQYLKGLLQYIREFMRDLLELIQEHETTKNNGTYAWRSLRTCRLADLHCDGVTGMEQECSIGGFADGEHAELAHSRTYRNRDIESMWDDFPTPLSALSTGPQNLAVGQRWAGALPLLFTTAATSLGGMDCMEATQGRVRRCSSSQGSQGQGREGALPSAGMKRRHSMSSTTFSLVTGMPSGS
jgi:hypothetical protein